jgi:hypothetical protein
MPSGGGFARSRPLPARLQSLSVVMLGLVSSIYNV